MWGLSMKRFMHCGAAFGIVCALTLFVSGEVNAQSLCPAGSVQVGSQPIRCQCPDGSFASMAGCRTVQPRNQPIPNPRHETFESIQKSLTPHQSLVAKAFEIFSSVIEAHTEKMLPSQYRLSQVVPALNGTEPNRKWAPIPQVTKKAIDEMLQSQIADNIESPNKNQPGFNPFTQKIDPKLIQPPPKLDDAPAQYEYGPYNNCTFDSPACAKVWR
jgi:hypothetical protein